MKSEKVVRSQTLLDFFDAEGTRDVGVQSLVPRRRNAQTNTEDLETTSRHTVHVCVGTTCECLSAAVSVSSDVTDDTADTPPLLRLHSSSLPSSTLPRQSRLRLSSFHIQVLSPEGKVEMKTVAVEGNNCRSLLAAADRQLAKIPLGDSPVYFTEENIYERNQERRRSLLCFDEETGNYPHIDLQDSDPANARSVLRSSLRFLRPSSPTPFSQRLPPVVTIQTEAEFLTVAPQKQLQAIPTTALTDHTFVALLFGFRAGGKIFWQLSRQLRYVSAESSRLREIGEIQGDSQHFVFLLFRDKDSVPRAKVKEGAVLRVCRRSGFEVRVERNHVRCAGPPEHGTSLDVWDLPAENDPFLKDFAAAAAR